MSKNVNQDPDSQRKNHQSPFDYLPDQHPGLSQNQMSPGAINRGYPDRSRNGRAALRASLIGLGMALLLLIVVIVAVTVV